MTYYHPFVPNSKAWKRKVKRAAHAHGVVLVKGFDPNVAGLGNSARAEIRLIQKSFHLTVNGKLNVETRHLLNRFPEPKGNHWSPNGSGQPRNLSGNQAVVYWANQTSGRLWTYTQGGNRMMGITRKVHNPRTNNISADCSSGFTYLCWLAGVPDPNGLGYNGYGYTGTMIDHGRRVSSWSALPIGGAIFYSTNGREATHVAMKISSTKVWSFGSPPGPRTIPYYYRSDIFAYVDYTSMWT